jgi:hypothetical protein
MLSSDARQEVEDEEEASDREKLTTRQCLDKYKAAAEALNSNHLLSFYPTLPD